ncbi:MAG: c-type cytochrome [Polaribacter sp.]|nr:c-type cytochrome [Polaribacter sp.]
MLQSIVKDDVNFTIKMRTFIGFISVLFFVSCQTSEKPKYSKTTKEIPSQIKNQLQEHPGKKLMENNCYVCHSPSNSHDNRIAPPMIAVKKHYKSSKTTKEEFKTTIQNWIQNPTKENSKMFGAVKRFGIMPKNPFPKKTIDLIADYMFDNKIEQPKWFEKHEKSIKKNE